MSESIGESTHRVDAETGVEFGKGGPWARRDYRTWFLSLLTLSYFFNMMDRQILSILLQPIKTELALDDWQLGVLGGIAFALFYVTMGVPIAKLSDRHNRITILSVSLGLWSLATAVCGATANFSQLMLARIGVAVGEAAGTPPSYSLITDLYEPGKRSTMTSIYILGSALGIGAGLLFGGWAAETIGWRWTFVAVGAPGLLLAAIIKLTLKEPPRGYSDGGRRAAENSTVREVVKVLFTQTTFIAISSGAALAAVCTYTTFLWVPSFYIRSHGLSVGQAGTMLGMASVFSALVGTFSGGYLADRLGRRSKRWWTLVPTLAIAGATPFLLIAFSVPSLSLSFAGMVIALVLLSSWAGPTYSTVQALVGVKMRAVSVSLLLFVINMIGMGIGPLVIGIVSDFFHQQFGTESLRYALYILPPICLAAGLVYYLASRTVVRDVERAPD